MLTLLLLPLFGGAVALAAASWERARISHEVVRLLREKTDQIDQKTPIPRLVRQNIERNFADMGREIARGK